jgi:hypothetical protein
MNEITSEYKVSDSTNANPMIIGTKSWLVLLGCGRGPFSVRDDSARPSVFRPSLLHGSHVL